MCAGDILGCFVDLVRYEGIASLYRGLLPALLSMAPAGAVFYGTYDFLKAAHLKAAASAAARQGGADGTVPAAAQQRGVFAVKQTGETGTRGEVGEGAERRRREGGLHGEMDSERRDAQKDAGTSQGAGAPSCSHSDSGPGDTIEATGHRSLGQDPPGGSASKEWPVPNSGHHGGSTSRQEPQGMGTREMQAAQQEGQQVHEQVALLVRHPPLPQQQSALQQLGVLPTLVYGAMAGAAAELATFPLEVVRRQMQLGGKTGRGGPLDIARVMKEVVQKGGGPQALYAGILPATLQVSSLQVSQCSSKAKPQSVSDQRMSPEFHVGEFYRPCCKWVDPITCTHSFTRKHSKEGLGYSAVYLALRWLQKCTGQVQGSGMCY